MAIVSTWPFSGDGTSALSAPTHVFSPYPRIPLTNSTDILRHKIPSAKFLLGRTVQVLGLLCLVTPGMGTSGHGITTWDQSSAGGRGRMQVFVTRTRHIPAFVHMLVVYL